MIKMWLNQKAFFFSWFEKKYLPIYCEVFDAIFETDTNRWLEKKCSNPDCCYCSKRPEVHPNDCKCEVEG